MRQSVCAIVGAIAVIALGSLVRGDGAGTSSDALQGRWASIAVEMTGIPAQENDGDMTLVFANNTVTVIVPGEVGRGTFRIDAAKSPKTIDIVYAMQDGSNPQRAFGLYKIDGDTLTWIFSKVEEEERPKGFECEPDKTHIMVTFKRSPE